MKNRKLHLKPLAITAVIALFLSSTAFIVGNVRNTFGNKSVNNMKAENEYLASLRVNPATGTIDAADYQRALKEARRLGKESSLKGAAADLTWESCGPDDLAGRMRSIVTYKGYWYAGSPDGGIWRTPFSASSSNNFVWTKIVTDVYNVSCMYVDGNTLYVGTGENFNSEEFNLLPGFKGTGLYKTTDGTSFTLVDGTDGWFYISKIAVMGSTVYVATSDGLMKSTDGSTWTTVIEGNCKDVTASNSRVLAYVNGSAYLSTDGTNFTNISTDEDNKLPSDTYVGRITFAIAPSDNNIIYATAIYGVDFVETKTYNEYGTLYNIYRSEDGGSTWHVIGSGDGWTMFYVFNGNGLYATAMTIDPTNPDRVFIGGMDLWEGTKVPGNNIFQWTQRTSAENSTSQAYVPQNHFQYMFVPSIVGYGETIVIACENGIYLSYRLGAISRSASCNINLITSQFYTVAADYAGATMGGSQGNGTVVINKSSYTGKSGSNYHILLGELTGNDYTFNNIGGYCHYSLIYPNAKYVSINGNIDLKDESQTAYSDFSGVQTLILYRHDGQYPQDISYWQSDDYYKAIEDSAGYIAPSILWEDFDWEYNTDVVTYSDTMYHYAGDTIYAASNNANYPIPYVLDQDLPTGSKIVIEDHVASRFFVGVKNLIFMTKYASNFNIDFKTSSPWWIISARDVNGVTGTPQCMAVSKDCNYLYVGTQEGRLFKISNLAYAQNETTARVCTYNASFSTCTPNPYCVVNTTELNIPTNGRTITSITVNPVNPDIVVVTLGNYGYNDYIYMTTNARSQNPTFTQVPFSVDSPVYTATFIENNEDLPNYLLIGTDFGIFQNTDVVNGGEFVKQDNGMGEVPVFMIRQQNVITPKDANGNYRPTYYIDFDTEETDTVYITSYRNIYAATYGGGLFECTTFNEQNKNIDTPTGINDYSETPKNSVSVFPNPVSDYANINISTAADINVEISIYNMNGSLIESFIRYSSNGIINCQINTADFPMGTYIVKVNTVNGTTSSKFIVVK